MSRSKTKKTPLIKFAVRLLVSGCIIGVVAAFLFGLNSREEWDVSSGNSRKITTCLGIPIWFEKPTASKLSEWLGEPTGDVDWVFVRGPSIPRAKVSWCGMDLYQTLHGLELDLTISERIGGMKALDARRQLASAVLDELRQTRSICQVARRLHNFRLILGDNERFLENGLTHEIMSNVWLQTHANPKHR